MRGLVQRLRNADRQIESLALLDVYGRVARTLLDMAEDDKRRQDHPQQGLAPGHGQGGRRLARDGQPGHEGPGRARRHRDAGKRLGDHQGTAARTTEPRRRACAAAERAAPIGHNRGHDVSARFPARRRRRIGQHLRRKSAARPAPPRRCRDRRSARCATRPGCSSAPSPGCWLLLALATHDAARPGLLHLGRRRAAAQQGRHGRRLAVRPGACSCSATRSGGWCRWRLRAWLSAWRARCARRRRRRRRASCRALAVLARPGAAAGGQLRARVDAPVPVGAAAARPCRRRARLHARAAVDAAGSALPARACCGSPRWWPACRWRCGFSWLARGRAHRQRPRRPARARASSAASAPRTARLGEQALREREQVVEVERQEVRGPPAAGDRADAARGAQVRARRQGAAEAAVQRAGRHQAAAGRPARRARRRASGDGDARVAGDDQRG